MFRIGDYVAHYKEGVCEVVNIGKIDMGSSDKEYYTLKPVYDAAGTVYTPVDNKREQIRQLITKEEAENLELEKNLFNLHEIRNLLIFLILGIFILLLSDYIGLLTCLCLSIIVYIKIQGKDPIWKAIFIGVAATIFLYIVFVWFLHVPVPEGPLGF